MRVLTIGGASLLGKYLTATKPESVDLHSTWYTNYVADCNHHLDVCNRSEVSYIFERVRPQVVVHCAAVGSVDYTEKHYAETRQINVVGTENVLRATQDYKALFVYISSNAVFGGGDPPYNENSHREPVNSYGRIKREAEDLLIGNYLIIRPFLLYGYPYPQGRPNWLTIILDKLKRSETVQLVNDTYWQPSLTEDVALAIWKLIDLASMADSTRGIQEVYHVASDDRMSLYEFGLKVAKTWGYNKKLIQPIASGELRGIARRPRDTTFDLSKIHSLGIKLRGVEEGLRSLK